MGDGAMNWERRRRPSSHRSDGADCRADRVGTKRALVHPVFFGSAVTGAGIDALTAAIVAFLPAVRRDADGPRRVRSSRSNAVRPVRRSPTRGSSPARSEPGITSSSPATRSGRVTAVRVFRHGGAVESRAAVAGDIAKLWGLTDIRIGDAIGEAPARDTNHQFAPPTLETVVTPRNPGNRGRLRVALDQLAEQDPLISIRQDDSVQELSVRLYGEVQKEVIGSTLASRLRDRRLVSGDDHDLHRAAARHGV